MVDPARLIRLYPRAWRERYGEEVLALMEQSDERGWRTNFDLARGCLGAWLMRPLPGWRRPPPAWVSALFLLAAWASSLVLLGLLTAWLRPAPIVWRAWLAVAVLVGVMARLFVKRFEAGPRALAPELAAFETAVLIACTLVSGTLLHKLPPSEGASHVRVWFLFFFDPIRLGIPHVALIFATMRLVWPSGFEAAVKQDRQSPSSTLGLSN